LIDIHSHILPGIDDGAETEKESIAMAKRAVEEGVRQIIATPHHLNRTYENDRTTVLKHVDVINALFQSNDIPLTVLPGQEIRIYGEMLEDYEHGEIIPLNDSKYILIEFPADSVPHYTGQLFYDVQIAGFVPVIAHPERNRELMQNPRKLYDLVRNGALSQITAASVVGKFGRQIEKFSNELLTANLVHFIASDVHNTTTRKSYLREAYETINSNYGLDMYYALQENSHLVIENLNVNRFEPGAIRKKRKRLFGFI
jgi:protein-tyrosine phosphatase